jgi:micrococcal nuclease
MRFSSRPTRHARRRSGAANVLPFVRPRRRRKRSPLLFVVPLAALAGVLLWDPAPGPALAEPAAASDRDAASFARCWGPHRVTCVVDGDTFWYRGEKIRIADINAPELGEPQCPQEAALAERATVRLTELLNAGPFSFAANPFGRDRDRYGRLLREVTRDGASLGARLTAEGLAEPWHGRRGDWCAAA